MADWTTEQITARIRGEADRQKVDPALALAVATQESYLNPNAKGDNGRSLGLFQLQPAASIDVGVNPQWRHEPGVNIYAGVSYLKQKLRQAGGNVEQALRLYNGGGDPNYVQNVMRFFKPGVAEAADRPQAGTYSDTDVQNALQALQGSQGPPEPTGGTYTDADVQHALRALQGMPDPAAPMPPTATSTPEQDAAYRASRGQQAPPPVSQTTPTASTEPGASQVPQTPDTSWTPGMRLQALPSMQQLEPAERTQRTQEFAALTPALQEEFLRSEEPASDLTVDIEKSSTPGAGTAALSEAQRQAQVQQELQRWEQQAGRPWREGDPRMPSEKRLGVPDEAPVTESLTAPSTMIPLLMPGAGLKAVRPLVRQAGPLLTRGARALAEGLSQTAGWGTGRTIETGQVPSPTELGTEAALNVAAGGILEGLGATGQAILRRSQAGKAIVAADEATTLARQEWQQATATAKAEQQAGRAEAYQAAERRAREAQVRYQTKVEARDATIAANEQTYQDALAASKAEVQAEQTRRYGQARTETMQEVGAAQARQQQYQQAVTGQEQALAQARAVPGRYTPETPSWVMYEKFGDAAKDAVVDLTPAKAALADVRASRGVLPDGSVRPFPAAVEQIATKLEQATGIEAVSLKTIREELRRLGPLTRSQDGNVRGAAKQLYGIYADVLEASPVANDLLRNANATFRKEMAVQDVAEWLTPGRGIVRIDNQGRETINVGALMTRLEKTVADDSLFRRSFAPDELDALRKDLRQLAGTPTMPRGAMPPAATPELLPGAAPNIPATMTTPQPMAVPRAVPRPRVEHLPGAAPGRRGAALPPEPPPVTPRQTLGERPRFTPTEGQLGAVGGLAYLAQLFGIPAKAVATLKAGSMVSKQLRYGTARMILGAQSRPQLMEALRKVQGRVGPPLYGTLLHGLSAAERKALQRETREQNR